MHYKSNRKLLNLIMIIVLILMSITIPVFATDEASLEVSSTTGVKGEKVEISVVLKGAQGVAGGGFTIAYDTSRLEVVSVSAGSVLADKSKLINPAYKDTKIRITWASGNLITTSGVLAKITFKIKETALKGTAEVVLEASNLYDMNAQAISRQNSNGSVVVNDGAEEEIPEIPVSEKDPDQTNNTPSAPIASTLPDNLAAENNAIIVKPSTDIKTGVATAAITDEQILMAVGNALWAVDGNAHTVVEIKVEAGSSAKNIALELSNPTIETLTANGIDSLEVETGFGTVVLDKKVLETIKTTGKAGATSEKVTISVAKLVTKEAVSRYSDSIKQSIVENIGDRPVYDFKIQAGNTVVSDFKGGSASISLPYTKKQGEDENAIVTYYIDDAGSIKSVPKCKYNSASGTVSFITSHFSTYAVGYKKVTFGDVGSEAWYKKAVTYMSARGIVNGSRGNFSPEKKVTRADFLIMVMKTFGIEIDSTSTENFVDAGNKYYTPYLATAKKLGLVSGLGGNKFAPEATISRQDVCVILYGVLNKLEQLPSQKTTVVKLDSFFDKETISDYSEVAMSYFVESGILSGNGRYLAPRESSTRAQVVQILYNLISK